jgi:hypothetical protein
MPLSPDLGLDKNRGVTNEGDKSVPTFPRLPVNAAGEIFLPTAHR